MHTLERRRGVKEDLRRGVFVAIADEGKIS